MKNATVLFLLLALPWFLFAQTKTTTDNGYIDINNLKDRESSFSLNRFNYTVAFKIMSVETFPDILSKNNKDSYVTSKFNGFLLKFNDKQLSYRLSGSFYNQKVEFINGNNSTENIAGNQKDSQVRLGVEKNINYSTLQPYLGFDIGYRRNTFNGKNNTNNFYNIERTGVTASPFLGIKLNIVNHITIAGEAAFELFYNKIILERDSGVITEQSGKSRTWETFFKPLGQLSIQYNFGFVD